MTAEQVNDFATYLALTGAVPAALAFFTFVLGRPRTWWHSLLGWTLALLLVSIMLVFILVLGRRLGGEYPGYQYTAIVVYSLLTVALWLVFVMIVRERRRGRALGFIDNPGIPSRKAAMSTPINPSTVPEVWYKAQRVLRTIVQALVVLVPIVNGVAAAIINYLNTQTDVEVPGWAFLWLNAALVGSALVMGLVARIMAVPGVNALLTKIGLGSVPASAIVAPQVVAIDPKVADNGAAATSQHTGGSGTLDGGGSF